MLNQCRSLKINLLKDKLLLTVKQLSAKIETPKGLMARASSHILYDWGGLYIKLAFTGSTEVGRDVALAAAEKLIPSTLELGGKSANIFFDDCKWDMALDGLQLGILFNQGQVCCAGSRVFVQEGIYDKFVEAAVKAFNQVKVDLPWEQDTQMKNIMINLSEAPSGFYPEK